MRCMRLISQTPSTLDSAERRLRPTTDRRSGIPDRGSGQDGLGWNRAGPITQLDPQSSEGMTVTDATSLASPGHGVETPAMLDAAHLSRSFGSRLAVDDVSFHVAPGETYGLLGPNGAGKTTTIRLVCGLLSANTGEVSVCGMPVSASTTTAKAQIGYVPQDVSLYPDLTARENLSFFGRLYRLSGAALSRRVDAVLELIDLTDRGNDRVESYSGGMKRRLNIGASLLHRPRPLVLDADRWGRTRRVDTPSWRASGPWCRRASGCWVRNQSLVPQL